jgi:hypothetical protein
MKSEKSNFIFQSSNIKQKRKTWLRMGGVNEITPYKTLFLMLDEASESILAATFTNRLNNLCVLTVIILKDVPELLQRVYKTPYYLTHTSYA